MNDHLGSTSVVTDEDGIMVELLDYNPYGTERLSWSSTSDDGKSESAKTYIGEYADSESGLSYLNARYSDPENGQFLSQDPVYLSLGSGIDKREQVTLLDPQSQNGYLYGRGNPVLLYDTNGDYWETAFDVGSALFDVGRAFYYEAKTMAALVHGDLASAGAYSDLSLQAQTDLLIDVGSTFIPFAAAPVVKNGVEGMGDVLRQVPVEKVSPYDLTPTQGIYKSDREMEMLTESIRNNGVQTPIKYVEDNGQRYIVDGHHRNQAAKDAGLQQVPVQKVELPYNGYSSNTDLNNWDRYIWRRGNFH